MPVEVYTSDNDQIVHMDYIDPWSVGDLLATVPKQKEICEKLNHPVSVVVNLLGTRHIPPGVVRARESPLLKSPQVQQIVAVGGPAIAKVLGDVVLKVVNFKKARFFDTKEDAMKYLRESIANESLHSAAPRN